MFITAVATTNTNTTNITNTTTATTNITNTTTTNTIIIITTTSFFPFVHLTRLAFLTFFVSSVKYLT